VIAPEVELKFNQQCIEMTFLKGLYVDRLDAGKNISANKYLYDTCKNSLVKHTQVLAAKQKKWIENRLFTDERLIDSTFVVKFKNKEDFLDIALPEIENIAQRFANRDRSLKKLWVSRDDMGSVKIERPVLAKKNEKKSYSCKGCETVVVGDKEWQIHCKSKKHKRNMKRIKN
jgi:uncharacterized protein YccT (UPF0319 family)